MSKSYAVVLTLDDGSRTEPAWTDEAFARTCYGIASRHSKPHVARVELVREDGEVVDTHERSNP